MPWVAWWLEPGLVQTWCGTVLPSQLLTRLRKEDQKFMQGLPSLWNQFQDRVGTLARACLKMGMELMGRGCRTAALLTWVKSQTLNKLQPDFWMNREGCIEA